MDTIILVCTGNTCRSPMAQALLTQALALRGVHGVRVLSAGVQASPGMPASGGAVRAMRSYGLDISAHRSSRLTRQMAQGARVLGMTRAHVSAARALGAPDAQLLCAYAGLGDMDIDDPFGGSDAVYLRTAAQLQEATRALADVIARGG